MSTAAPSTAIARKPELIQAIERATPQFKVRLPEGVSVEKFQASLMTCIQKNPALLRCKPASVLLAAYEAAERGIDLTPSRGLGYLIPYGDECQFQIGYRGMVQEAYRTGMITSFYAEVVYENDVFSREYAPKRTIRHIPPSGDRGEPIGCYSLVEFKDGRLDFEYMTSEQIARHRSASKMRDSMMWKTFWEEGWRKTPIRVQCKRLPMENPGMERLAELIEKDEENDRDVVIPGNLELEPDSPLAHGHTAANGVAPATAPIRNEGERVHGMPGKQCRYHVGKMLTFILDTGEFKPADLKPCGLRIDDKTKIWTIPGSLTEDFLQLCDARKIEPVECDEAGKPLPQTQKNYAANDSDLPAGLFEPQVPLS